MVYPKVIRKHLMSELPFMATENIMMDAVKKGGDRQELHERIRELSMEAGKRVKEEGLDNNLLSLIAQEPMFMTNEEELAEALEVSRQTIGSLENGRYNPSILLAFKIARYFGMPIEDIFIYEEAES